MVYEVLKYQIVDEEIIITIIYYETISPQLALKFESQIEKALDELETNPEYYFNLEDKNTAE